MHDGFATINTFIEDSCVLIVFAFVLARGRMLSLPFRRSLTWREQLLLGGALGLLAVSEAIFPDARFPYAAHTLSVTFASIVGGLPVGLIAGAMATGAAFVSQIPAAGVGTMVAVLVSALLGRQVRKMIGLRARLAGSLAAGAAAQACRLLIKAALANVTHVPFQSTSAWISVAANGFGVMLLVLVVSDAQTRVESEQRRIDMEHAQLLATEARLSALKARVHPHFLFNTLASIVALCDTSPERAKAAIRGLGQLMRKALQSGGTVTVCLADEMETVRTYLAIEQERLGDRLKIEWRLDSGCDFAEVPPFALQNLCENAVNHGIAPLLGAGKLTVEIRRRTKRVMLAVADTGEGISHEARRRALAAAEPPTHGLQIIDQHLRLLYGPSARLRLFGAAGKGTIAAFAIPAVGLPLEQEHAHRANR